MALYIVTLAEMKAELGIDDSVDDSVLTEWLEGLQGRIDGSLERTLLEGAGAQEIFDGGKSSLYVERWPIESVSEILIDGDQDWTDPDTTLDSDDYLVAHKRGRIVYGRGNAKWPSVMQGIRVTYTGGLIASDGTAANSNVKDSDLQAVRRAMFMQAGFEWRNRKTLGVTSISGSGVAKQVGAGATLAIRGKTLLPEVEETLFPLRRIL